MHGGLSPDLQSMEQIRRVMRPTDVPDTGAFFASPEYSQLGCLIDCCDARTVVRSTMVRP